ncbi:MAG: hypothetical protein AMXMBFR84_16980 [Candidatus Hydrogenedentota bacterium]
MSWEPGYLIQAFHMIGTGNGDDGVVENDYRDPLFPPLDESAELLSNTKSYDLRCDWKLRHAEHEVLEAVTKGLSHGRHVRYELIAISAFEALDE